MQLKAMVINKLNITKKQGIIYPILLPVPKKITEFNGNRGLVFNSQCNILFLNVINPDFYLNNLNEALEFFTGIKIKKASDEPNDLLYAVLNDTTVNMLLDLQCEEGYNLEIEKNFVMIYSIHERGLFYGLQTLIQLLKNGFLTQSASLDFPREDIDEILLPEIKIRDKPDLKIRGVAQDISRGQSITVDFAKRYITILSHYKMNFYCLYIEDMFSHPKHPLIGKNRGALTKKEIQEIDNYAKERYVEFVPIFECLGHVDNILSHKEYEDLGEYPGAQCFNIANKKVFDYLDDFIFELSNTFTTKYFHIGCDESFDFGKYNSKELINQIGKNQAYLKAYERIYKIAKDCGKEHIIMYHDIVANDNEILQNLNKDIIIMFWDYKPRRKYPKVEKLLEAGFQIIVSPSMLNWQRHFPDNKNSSKNVISLIKKAYEHKSNGCLGVLTSTWGDFRYYSLRENEIFGAVLSGSASWSCENFDYDQFKRNFGFLFYGLQSNFLKTFNDMFSQLSKSTSLYYKIGILLPSLFYTYLFKHPFPSKRYRSSCKNNKKLGSIGEKCLDLSIQLKPFVRFEQENFEYIEYSAELAKYLKEKIEISENTSIMLKKRNITKEEIANIISNLNYIKGKFNYLKLKYEKLWLRAAKRPCLDFNLKLFDFIINCYHEKINQLNQGVFFEDPYIKSEWIWVNEKLCPLQPRFFRKVFLINDSVKKAMLQGIACNHMKIFLNSTFVGEVFSRFSLSILPIYNRVKVFDITEYLKVGRNIITIEAYNYEGFKGAINIFGQILLNDNTIQEIYSNQTWLCSKTDRLNNFDWKMLDYDDSDWKKAKSYGRPPNLNGDIFITDLLDGQISLTQDYFGLQSFFFNSLKILTGYFYGRLKRILGFILVKLIKSLIKLIIKGLKPFD
ncbi:MAG: family 20 glycosylhydrolase [Promethearchaeota archaeon]